MRVSSVCVFCASGDFDISGSFVFVLFALVSILKLSRWRDRHCVWKQVSSHLPTSRHRGLTLLPPPHEPRACGRVLFARQLWFFLLSSLLPSSSSSLQFIPLRVGLPFNNTGIGKRCFALCIRSRIVEFSVDGGQDTVPLPTAIASLQL